VIPSYPGADVLSNGVPRAVQRWPGQPQSQPQPQQPMDTFFTPPTYPNLFSPSPMHQTLQSPQLIMYPFPGVTSLGPISQIGLPFGPSPFMHHKQPPSPPQAPQPQQQPPPQPQPPQQSSKRVGVSKTSSPTVSFADRSFQPPPLGLHPDEPSWSSLQGPAINLLDYQKPISPVSRRPFGTTIQRPTAPSSSSPTLPNNNNNNAYSSPSFAPTVGSSRPPSGPQSSLKGNPQAPIGTQPIRTNASIGSSSPSSRNEERDKDKPKGKRSIGGEGRGRGSGFKQHTNTNTTQQYQPQSQQQQQPSQQPQQQGPRNTGRGRGRPPSREERKVMYVPKVTPSDQTNTSSSSPSLPTSNTTDTTSSPPMNSIPVIVK